MFVMAKGEKKPYGGVCPSHEKLCFPVKQPKQDLAVARGVLWVTSSNLFPQTPSQLQFPPSREFDFYSRDPLYFSQFLNCDSLCKTSFGRRRQRFGPPKKEPKGSVTVP